MTSGTGIINDILTHSFVDGPGNRAVVFLQGCTLNCLYCHNPYTINTCIHCGDCVPACPHGALTMVAGRVVWDEGRCEGCDACIKICPHQSSPKTRELSAIDLWARLAPHAPFLTGVTVSGGEPTMQLAYLTEFFTLVKESSSLTTLIETNGTMPPARLERLLPVLDHAMVDLKAWEPEAHRALTGRDGAIVRETIAYYAEKGKLHAVRQVVAPGFTDSAESARETARFIVSLDPQIPLRFLRFRPHGTQGIASSWESPSTETLEQLVAIARAEGLKDVAHSL